MFEWITGNGQAHVVTLNSHNLTLNQNASQYFVECNYVLVGFGNNNSVGIKPVTKHDLDLNTYPLENLHKISLGKGYAKINNKALIALMESRFGIQFSGQKVIAQYNNSAKVLVFELNALVRNEVSS